MRVRTVGGGETWDGAVEGEIVNILARRDQSRIARITSDYSVVDAVVTFMVSW